MSQILKQSTAYTFRLGPFLDSTDGNTQENALTIAYTDVLLSKAGGALTAKSDTTALTGTGANGHYTCVLNATDTGTLGGLRVWSHITGALAVWQDFEIVSANVYDSLIAGTDLLDINTAQWLGTAPATPTVAGVPEIDLTHIGGNAQSGTDLKAFADAGYDPITNKIQGVVLTDTTTTNTDMRGTDNAALATTLDTVATYVDTEVQAILDIVGNVTYGNSALLTHGDAAWATATGFSTHTAADVWAVATRALTDKVGFQLDLTQTVAANTSATPSSVGDLLYLIRQLTKNKLEYVKATDVMTLYKDGGTVALMTFAMVDDATSAKRGEST